MPPTKIDPNNKKLTGTPQINKTVNKKETINKDTLLKEVPNINSKETIRDKYIKQENAYSSNNEDSDQDKDKLGKSNKTIIETKSETKEELDHKASNINLEYKLQNDTQTKSKIDFSNTEAIDKLTITVPSLIHNTIKFSIYNKNYSFLSNYYCSDIVIDNERYYHVEGYYQAFKFVNISDKLSKRIQFISDPIIANKRGNSHVMTNEWKNEWNTKLRDKVMKRAILIKFITNLELLNKLLNTGNSILIQTNIDDTYWATDKEGRGDNKLGQILMEVRSIIGKQL